MVFTLTRTLSRAVTVTATPVSLLSQTMFERQLEVYTKLETIRSEVSVVMTTCQSPLASPPPLPTAAGERDSEGDSAAGAVQGWPGQGALPPSVQPAALRGPHGPLCCQGAAQQEGEWAGRVSSSRRHIGVRRDSTLFDVLPTHPALPHPFSGLSGWSAATWTPWPSPHRPRTSSW